MGEKILLMQKILSILTVFALMGVFRTNEPLSEDNLFVYSSISNFNGNTINDVRFRYSLQDYDGNVYRTSSTTDFDVGSRQERGKLSVLGVSGLNPGEYLLRVRASSSTDNNFGRIKYRPIIIWG